MKELDKNQIELIKKQIPNEAVNPHPTKPYLSSIKAIYVTERLNDVFGIGKWSIKVSKEENGGKGMVVVKVILEIPEYGIYYESFGGNDNGGDTSKNFDLGDAYKGATTDAITKICSYIGIGIDVFKGLQKGKTDKKEFKNEIKKEGRDLLEIINDIKAETDTNNLQILKDEGKEIARSEKQKEWLKNEYTKVYNLINK